MTKSRKCFLYKCYFNSGKTTLTNLVLPDVPKVSNWYACILWMLQSHRFSDYTWKGY